MNTFNRRVATTLLAACSMAPAFATTDPIAAAREVLSRPDFNSTYVMSSGKNMEVTSFGDAIRVRYGRQPPRTLQHDGEGRFVSRDGKLVLEFGTDRLGEPKDVRLSMPADWS